MLLSLYFRNDIPKLPNTDDLKPEAMNALIDGACCLARRSLKKSAAED